MIRTWRGRPGAARQEARHGAAHQVCTSTDFVRAQRACFQERALRSQGGNLLRNRDGRRAPDGLCRGRIDMLGTLARQGPTTSNHKHIKKSKFTIKVTRAVNEDYKLRAGIDDEWVYVPDKTARKNKDVQYNGSGIDEALDKG